MRHSEQPQPFLLFPIPGEPPRARAQFLRPTLTEGIGVFAELQCTHGHLPTFPAYAGWRPLTSAPLCPDLICACPLACCTICCSSNLKASYARGHNPLVHQGCSPGLLSIFCFLFGASQVQQRGQESRRGKKQRSTDSRYKMHIPLSGKSPVVLGFGYVQNNEE